MTSSPTPLPSERLRAERRRCIRHFHRYTPEQRANHAASHRLGPRQRNRVGEYFWTHPSLPGRSYPTRNQAARAACRLPPAQEIPTDG